METFKELIISGAPSKILELIDLIDGSLDTGWARRKDLENNLKGSLSRTPICYSCDEQVGRSAASLWITFRDEKQLRVSNIVPLNKSELSFDEYNQILTEFTNKFVSENVGKLGLDIEVTAGILDIFEYLSDDSYRKLEAFSGGANKSTGTSHPMDQNRWFSFLVSAHKEKADLCAVDLERWLIEQEEWPADVATRIIIQYEQQRELLNYYDRS